MTRNGDFDSAHVYSDSAGFYLRFTDKGTYTLSFSKEGYHTKNIANFNVSDYLKKYPLDVELCPIGMNTITQGAHELQNAITIIPSGRGVKIAGKYLERNGKAGIYNTRGKLITMLPVSSGAIVWDGTDNNGTNAGNGCYLVKLMNTTKRVSKSFILQR
jgi:hypothetical protein